MTRLPIPGSDDGSWGTVLDSFLSVEHNNDGSLKRASAIDAAVPQATQVLAGSGLSIGGSLATDQTLAVVADSTVQRVQISTGNSAGAAGTVAGTHKQLNFVRVMVLLSAQATTRPTTKLMSL